MASDPQPPATIKRTLLGIFFAFAVAGMIGAIGLAYAVTQAGYWLEAPAQTPKGADAIVILGGDDGDRALRALGLYKEGYAPTIVLTGLERGVAAPPATITWRAEFLSARGVPRSAIRFEPQSKNSYEEALGMLALMRETGWQNVIVISDPPHMRRLAWTWERVFRDSGLHYVLVASSAPWWSSRDWWRNEQSGGFVIMEFIKLAYYVVKK